MKTIRRELNIIPESFKSLGRYLPSDNYAVFDIETTGLSANFSLVNLSGFVLVSNGKAELIQFFAEDPTQEESLLVATAELMSSISYLVTYNGKFFDVPFLKRYSFRFFVPVSKGKKIDTITLKMKYQSLVFRIGMTFTSPFARLSNLKNSYYHFLDRVMVYDRKSQSLIIRKATDSLLSINENKLLSEASKKLSVSELLYYRQLRKALRRRIKEKNGQKQLLFYDDMGINYNGNLLFRYFCKNKKNDSITLCYVDRRDSGQQRFLINAGYENIYESGLKKAKIEAMASDIIFATDCDVYESLGFNEKDMLYLRDLFSAEIVSIKNFFMTYATAQFDNRLRDNTQLFFAASENEKNHVMKSIYDYDESMIHITGYPILDTISDKKKRRILIAPGDRRQFVIYNNSDFYRFSESRFFNVYNSLICDTELIRTAKENNYTIDVLMPQKNLLVCSIPTIL